jgi:hypothetical protein
MPDVRDQTSLREAYLRLGWQLATTHDHETGAAREAERRVKREIADWRDSSRSSFLLFGAGEPATGTGRVGAV